MSRQAHGLILLLAVLGAVPAAAQDQDAAPVETATPAGGDCSQAEKDVAAISGEILVCGNRAENDRNRLESREAAQTRYARETMFAGDPQAPDVAGPGIFRGKPTIGGICGIGLQKCPPPPAYIVDFDALPDAPPGSDADRISRGLPPIGNEVGISAVPTLQANAAALGLPPVAEPAADAEVNPSGSASPAAEPPG